MSTRLAAVLWDMDGTIVDTEPYWIAAEHEVVEMHGGTWSLEHGKAVVGKDLLDTGAYVRDNGPVPLTPHRSWSCCSTAWSPPCAGRSRGDRAPVTSLPRAAALVSPQLS